MKTMENDMEEFLKDALTANDVVWLKEHEAEFDIDYRFKDCDNDTLLLYAISDAGSEVYRYLLQRGRMSLQQMTKGICFSQYSLFRYS